MPFPQPAWLLPEHIADILPPQAQKIEALRRRLLDQFQSYGYELVAPPLLEYIESLSSGAGQDLEGCTFKLVDQLSGRILGLRADMTPQISRIDAHVLNRAGISRLCYAASVVQTHPAGLFSTREPYQVGAELYGYAGLEADAEIQQLLVESLAIAGLKPVRLEISHAAIVPALLASAPQAPALENALFEALAAKDLPRVQSLSASLPADLRKSLLALPTLYGEVNVLQQARAILPTSPEITRALDDLTQLTCFAQSLPDVDVMIDLADLRGYRYHSGVMFSAYIEGIANAVVRGGRYDNVGALYGRARAATGFSLDLREITRHLPSEAKKYAIRAPWPTLQSTVPPSNAVKTAESSPGVALPQPPDLQATITALRAAGEIVIQGPPTQEPDHGHGHGRRFICDRELIEQDGHWQVKRI